MRHAKSSWHVVEVMLSVDTQLIKTFRQQVSSETLEPHVSGTLTLFSTWYPGPGFTGEPSLSWDFGWGAVADCYKTTCEHCHYKLEFG